MASYGYQPQYGPGYGSTGPVQNSNVLRDQAGAIITDQAGNPIYTQPQ